MSESLIKLLTIICLFLALNKRVSLSPEFQVEIEYKFLFLKKDKIEIY